MLAYTTAERVSARHVLDPVNYNRHLFAYQYASNVISGNIIEIGCGDGYGIKLLLDQCDHYVGIDKVHKPHVQQHKNIDFFKIVLPGLKNIPRNIFDFAVSFQVIEHIKDDALYTRELHRILKPGGTLLLTTPNRLRSASRNPWHVREYTSGELEAMVADHFSETSLQGIFGSETVVTLVSR